MKALPKHLQKYIVEQNYSKYTPIDQACWRFIMRQLKAFLSQHAHECYVEGLEKTGIDIETIPKIEDISKKLEKFGWRALPVSGFIPPAAFMELQSLSILPIASDMRTLDHLTYTPAPDIVHEAAGHAPILIHPEFAAYLKHYADVAKKAIISSEDLDLYEAIRKLSDIKESPDSTEKDIEEAQRNLNQISKNISHVSEASELSRMNWWTAEYGLIGDIQSPKIFGAGLLSSVGESKWCLSDKVKKIPLTVDCIRTTYDITEPQPQLFVTPDFKTLSKVLEQMADKMAFRVGKKEGLQKAIRAKTVNTFELNSGIQISGMITEAICDNDHQNPIYVKTQGPTQLCYKNNELSGHNKKYHNSGFGTAIGYLQKKQNLCPSLLTESDLKELGFILNQTISFEFTSKVKVEGRLKNILYKENKIILMSFENARVTYQNQVLFDPSWGTYDMAVGSVVKSVFAGPADRISYGETEDFIAARVPTHHYTENEKLLHSQYQEIRNLRNSDKNLNLKESELKTLLETHDQKFPNDWLFRLEALELFQLFKNSHMIEKLKSQLINLQNKNPAKKDVIEGGLQLIH